MALAWYMYGRSPVRAASIGVPRNPLHKLLLEKYYVDELYDCLFVRPIYRLSLWLARVFDPARHRRARQRDRDRGAGLGARPAPGADRVTS